MKNSFLFLLMFSAFALPQTLAASAFSDVWELTPHAEAIAYIKDKGIVDGYADGTFAPQNNINRYDFTKIIIGARFTPQQKRPTMPLTRALFVSMRRMPSLLLVLYGAAAIPPPRLDLCPSNDRCERPF